MKNTLNSLALLALLSFGLKAQNQINREILPIVEPEAKTYTELDVRNTTPPQRFEVKAPEKAPNVVIVFHLSMEEEFWLILNSV